MSGGKNTRDQRKLQAVRDIVQELFRDDAAKQADVISLSNNTVTRRHGRGCHCTTFGASEKQ